MTYIVPDRISKNFTLEEFTIASSKEIPDLEPLFVYLLPWLQEVRTLFGNPVTITSFYRDEEYNRMIGGSSKSAHVKAMAVDFTIREIDNYEGDQLEIYEFLAEIHPDIRICLYKGTRERKWFIHMDCGRIYEPQTYPAWREIKSF